MTQLVLPGFDGQLLAPGQQGYDTARTVWNAMVDRRPALVARCATTSDVVAAVRYGRGAGLEIGVLCGGHSVLGLPVSDGGLLIDLSPMGGVRVDPDNRLAWVGGGALLGALDRAAQAHGLATTAGNVSHTGVGGLTLGGGVGWLSRLHGLSCDNLASCEVVTADGSVLRASEDDHGDLFWGLRGGGGNFGVVTEFEFRLHPVGTRTLVAELYYQLADGAAALRGWRDLLDAMPRRATPVARVGVRTEQALPAELRGRPVASIGFVWVGDPAEGRLLLPALRDVCPSAAERVEELSYVELQTADDDVDGHGLRRYWKGHYLRELTNEAIDAFLDRGGDPLRPGSRLTLNAGAITDIGDDGSAYSHRDALIEFTTSTAWTDPAEDSSRMTAARVYAATIEAFASGAYVNALADEGDVGVRRAYSPDKLARLAALKRRYDPDNAFHLNPNIRPSSGQRLQETSA